MKLVFSFLISRQIFNFMVNIWISWLLVSIRSNIFQLTASNVFRTRIVFNEFSFLWPDDARFFPQDGSDELWNLREERNGDTKTSVKIEDTGSMNQREWEYYRVTGKAPALVHSFVARRSNMYFIVSKIIYYGAFRQQAKIGCKI